MSKELEALEDIILYLNANEPKGLYCKNIEIIKVALKRLENYEGAWHNTNLKQIFISMEDWKIERKQLKALEIIKEKQVDIHNLIYSQSLEEYNTFAMKYNQELCNTLLTQEEYELLKEVLL